MGMIPKYNWPSDSVWYRQQAAKAVGHLGALCSSEHSVSFNATDYRWLEPHNVSSIQFEMFNWLVTVAAVITKPYVDPRTLVKFDVDMTARSITLVPLNQDGAVFLRNLREFAMEVELGDRYAKEES